MEPMTYLTFLLYLLLLFAIGLHFYKQTNSSDEYLLGGRKLGYWVTALSAQASDMSGWLLMGLPGTVLLLGLGEVWIAIGLFLGTLLNWTIVAPTLRLYTEKCNAITLPSFFESRFGDTTGSLRIFSSLLIITFYAIYVSSGLVASGKLFHSMFNIDYATAIAIGLSVIALYTFLGGYLAVCWTDVIQGSLMFFALTVVPLYAWFSLDNGIVEAAKENNISLSLLPHEGMIKSLVAIISSLSWGLGYCGQPHILARFMSISSVNLLPKARRVALIWVFISLTGAVWSGLDGIALYGQLKDSEQLFVTMVYDLFIPSISGIMLAAILSAIMSTIDSQLLVSCSAVTEDLYKKSTRYVVSDKKELWLSRFAVIAISIAAFILAMDPESSVFKMVSYAWSGFGAAFGPVILFALYSKKCTWYSALSGMAAAIIVIIGWKATGWNNTLYELIPGFVANSTTIALINSFAPQKNSDILARHDEVRDSC